MDEWIPLHQIVSKANNLANQILYLAQSSLSEHQFTAFRKLALDYLADFQ